MTHTLSNPERVAASPCDGHARPDCPVCDSALTLHQPDEAMPERLLAICPTCKSWFVLDCETGASEMIQVGVHAA